MRSRNMLVLLAVAVLVSLGAATQYADAFTTNGRIVGTGANEVDGTFYHKADNNGVYIKVIFAGDRTASGSSGWADAIKVGDRAPNGALTLTNANSGSRVVGSAHDYSSSSEFSFEYKLENLDDGATTIVFPAGVIGPAGNPTDRNPKLTYTFVYDSTDPIMSNDFTGVLFERGDLIHRGNVLVVAACDDINRTSDITFASGPDPDTSRIGDYVKSFSCTDNAGNTATATKLYRVIEPINISIASDNVYDTSKARYNDEVTVTFDLATGSTFTGSVSDDGNNRNLVFATVGNTGTMTKTLNGDENSNSQITFSLTVTDSDGPSKTYTAVQGTGDDTSVTTDFDYPTTPDNISIAHNGAGGATSVAKFGDIVTVTFDTDTDATRTTGTIGGKDATYALDGTTGKLTITLDGTESSEVQPLPFSFRIFDYVGNGGDTQTAVKGTGDDTSVTSDTVPPVAPSFFIPKVLFNTTPISLSGLAEAGSTVELFKGDTSVGTVSAGSGVFEFTGVELTEGQNFFTITATDASSNTSLFSGTEILILDTTDPDAPIFTTSPTTVGTTPITLAGTAEADSTVELYKGETFVATVTATTGGNFEFTGVALTEESTSFTVTATDAASNISAKSAALVITLDTAAPTITVTPLEVTLELNSASPTLLDGVSTDDGSTVTTTGTVDVSTVDDYTIRYDSTDGTNAATTVTRTYHVTDTTAPTITVTPLEVTLELDSASPTLLDGVSTDDGSTVTTTGTVDVSTVDDYTIRYDSTDGTNAATTVTRTYHVTDTKAPIITVDPLEVTLELDSASPTLLDGVSTDDGSTVTTTGTVDVSTVDDYTIRYDSTDGTNAATTVTRTYHVTDTTPDADTTAPDAPIFTNSTTTVGTTPITLAGTAEADSTVELYKGETSVATATATGGAFEFTGVALTEEGNSFTVTATDAASNISAKSAALVITLDTAAPTITVTPLEVTLELNSASPTLLDGVSTDDGSTVTTTGTVDVSTVDDYTIRYDSTDGTNAATTVTRTYHVTDTTAPTITVTPLEVTLELDSASPTLLDGVSTDDGSTVTTTGTVDVSTVDDYTIRYDSTDGTNAATTVTRTYHVTDTAAPATPDTTPPATPVFANPSFSIVNTTHILLHGTAEPNSLVTLYSGGITVVNSTSASNTGTFEFLKVALTEGNNYFNLKATDASLNTSTLSYAVIVFLDTIPLAVPTDISIASDNADPTLAKSGDIVTITFDTEEGSIVDGTIDGKTAEFGLSGTVGTLKLTLDGTEPQDAPLTFKFTQSDAAGNKAETQTAVKGTGDDTSVTADFIATVPTNISIASDNTDYPTRATSGDTVTVTFDTEEGSTVKGTIGGKNAKFDLSGTVGTLTLRLSGDEAQGVPLTFEFTQTDAAGNVAETQTAVKGAGDTTFVNVDITAAIPTNITITSDNDRDPTIAISGDTVTITFDTEVGSTVYGSIDGLPADPRVRGTVGTLTLTLDGNETENEELTFEFTRVAADGDVAARQTAVTGTGDATSVTADFTPPAVPDNISIASSNDDPTKAKLGDILTVTFDTDEDSAVEGTIIGKNAKFDLSGTVGTLKLTLIDLVIENRTLAFAFTQSDAAGNEAETQFAVKGTGVRSSVTADFTPPVVPTKITIFHNGLGTNATSGDIVTVTFETEEDSKVKGTIAGRNANFELSDTFGTLELTLDGSEPQGVPLTFNFTQFDATGNNAAPQTAVKGGGFRSSVIADFTPLAVPTNISITSSNDDPTIAKLDDTVTITFDTEAGSLVEGTIAGKNAKFDLSGTVGTLKLTLDGTEPEDVPLTFEFTQSDDAGNEAETQTAVKGTLGDATSVTADFTPPVVPTNISIASNNADTSKAELGNIVTVTFDTEEGSTVKGTIGGENATFAFNGASSTLTRTLDGTEPQDTPLTFEFTQFDAAGNEAETQTAVKGTPGDTTSVIADFLPPAVSPNTSIASSNDDPTQAKLGDIVTVTFDAEVGSSVVGTIAGKTAIPDVTGTVGTLKLTLSGDETNAVANIFSAVGKSLAFEFTTSNAAGNLDVLHTTVIGTGAKTSVTADFTPPTVPANISISHDGVSFIPGQDVNATSGDIVVILFDTEEGSLVKGTIDGKNAAFALSGTFGSLELTLDGTEPQDTPLTFEFTQFDAAGNEAETQTAVKGSGSETSVIADFTAPAVPTNISIASNNTNTSLAKLGDIVTVTFDTEEGSLVDGTIDGKNAEFGLSGTVGTLKLTLDGTETDDLPLTFEFTITDAAGNAAETQSAVKGTPGDTTFVIADFIATAPTNISIASNNTNTSLAKLGDIVTVTFDTEEGSLVDGTIDGKNAEFGLSGTVGTLKLTLDGTETDDLPLPFEFTITDAAGNVAETPVNGTTGDITSVTADFTLPAVPTSISISHNGYNVNAISGDIVTVTFDTEEGSLVDGTIDGKNAKFGLSGTVGTLKLTLDGTVTEDVPLTFEFTQFDAAGNAAEAQDAVKGSGARTSVTVDRTPPAIPTNITITSDNANDPTIAISGDTVTVAFDTEVGSTVYGSIDGLPAEPNVIGTRGTLKLTLDGSGTEDRPLTFEFTRVAADGDVAARQTAVTGTGDATSVTADFTPPAVPDNISIASSNDDPTKAKLGDILTVTFDTDEDSAVEGTIIGKNAKFDLSGTVGTLKLTLIDLVIENRTLAFAFTQSDAAGNEAETQFAVKGTGVRSSVTADFTPPVVPTKITIFHNGLGTNATSGDIVTVTFETEEDSKVKGTIAGRNANFELSDTFGTLELTLDGSEPQGVPLTFNFTQFDATGNNAAPQTAVKGGGFRSSVIADFTPLAVPTNISITSSNDDPTIAKLDDTVTITFDTEAGSLVEGTIAGKNAKFDLSGTVGTLKLTLDGTEPEDVPLTFEFTQSDDAGNEAETQTAVKGTLGDATSVTADFTPPVVPTNISIASNNADTSKAELGNIVTVTFDTEEGSTVKGTIGGENATFAFNGASSTLTRTLDGTEPQDTPLTFEFTQFDAAGNEAETQTAVKGTPGDTTSVIADFLPPAVSPNTSIASSNDDPTQAKLGDIVTVTFDAEVGSSVVGTIAGKTAIPDVTGTVGTLKLTLSGDETNAVANIFSAVGKSLAFEFTTSNAAGNLDVLHTTVIGTGAKTSVTADFTPPTVPANISISHDGVSFIPGQDVNATSGDIVVILFDTEEGSLVKGTIDGKNAAFALSGTFGSLELTLDGTEPQDTPLTFEFTQFDAAGNEAETQTAVKGSGSETSVIADFTAPAIPVFSNSTTSVGTTPVTLAGTAEADSTVTLYKGETFVATVTATGGTFEFAGVVLDEGSNDFTITATDAPSNVSAKSDVLVITLDTAAPIITVTPLEVTLKLDSASPTLLDGVSTDDGSTVTATGTVDVSIVGDYTIDYDSTDGINAANTTTRTYHVSNITAPIITVTPLEVTLELNSASPALLDGVSTDDGSTVTATGTVDVSTVGDYTINYDSTDDTNVATRTYHVIDTTSPAIPVFSNSTASVSSSPVTLAGNAEADSTVELFKGETSVANVTATGGTFEFTGVVLAEGSNSFTLTATDASSNVSAKSGALVITLDTIVPVFATSTVTTDVTFGDTVPTLSTLCTDANTITVTNDAGSTIFDADGDKTILYTCTDAAGNTATQSVSYSVAASAPGADTTAPAAPIFTTSPATVSTTPITLAGTAEADSTVELYNNGTSVHTTAATSGTFEFTGVVLAEGSNSFTLTATDASSNISAKSSAILIVLDTMLPAVPTNISIASNNDDTSLAKLGDVVTITFDTEEGSLVDGTIDGKNAEFAFNGTSSTLARTLDGTETEDAPLSFKFIQTDAAGNVAVPQTAVKGSGDTTSVTVDFVAPAFDDVYISTNVLVGNAIPTLTCTDYASTTLTNDAGSTIFDAEETKSVTYTCADAAGNTATKTIGYNVASVSLPDTTLIESHGHTFQSGNPLPGPFGVSVTNIFTPGTSTTATYSTNSTSFQFIIISGSFTPYSNPVLFAIQDGNVTSAFTSPVKRDNAFIFTIPNDGFDLTKELKFRAEYVLGGSSQGKYYAETVFTVAQLSALVTPPSDTTPPAIPVFTNSSSTVSSSPVTLAGDADDGSTVELYNNGTSVHTTAATSGTFEFTGVVLAEGSNSFTLTATDASSNTSAKSDALVITLDTAAPAGPTPIITTPSITTSLTQIPITIDFITLPSDFTDSKVFKLIDRDLSTNISNLPFGDLTLSGSSYSFDIRVGNHTLPATIVLRAPADLVHFADGIGNKASAILTITYNPASVVPPADTDFTVTSVISSGLTQQFTAGSVLNVTNVNVIISGTGPAGTDLTATFGVSPNSFASSIQCIQAGKSISDCTPSTTIAADGTWNIPLTITDGETIRVQVVFTHHAITFIEIDLLVDPPSDTTPPVITPTGSSETVELELTNSYSELGGTVADNDSAYSGTVIITGDAPDTSVVGTYTVLYDAPDDASGNSAVQQSIVITVVDSTPLAIPVFTNSSSTVSSSPVILAGTAEAGSTVKLYTGTMLLDTVTADDSGNFEFADVVLTKSLTGFTVTASDGLNTSAESESILITLDTIPPADTTAPAIPVFTNSSSTVSSSPVILAGTAEADSTVKLYSGTMLLDTVTADDSGNFEFADVVLTKSLTGFTVTASDGLNTSAESESILITLDTIPPADTTAPAIPVFTNSSSTVSSSPVILAGTAEAGSEVDLSIDGTYSDTVTADGSGDFKFTGVILFDGPNSFTITAYDGTNTSDKSAPLVVTLDSTPPAIPVFTNSSSTVSTELITLVGTAEAGSEVDLSIDGTYSDTVTADGSGDFKFTGVMLFDGPNSFTITAYDGTNTSDKSAPLVVTLDSTPPSDTTSPVITPTGSSKTVELELTNSYSELGGTVVDDDSTYSGTVIITGDAPDTSVVGTYTVLYNAPDDASGNSAVQQSIVITVVDTTSPADTTPPIITLTGAITQSIDLGDGYTELGATSDDGSIVTIDATAFTDTVGSYDILYDSVDAAGNPALQVIRVVTVVEIAPVSPVKLSTPTITTIPATVTTTPITIEGTADVGSAIFLFNNGEFVRITFTDGSGDFTFTNISLNLNANSFTVYATAFGKLTSDYSDPVVITFDSAETKKKKSSSSNDWHKKPTFGKSHLTHKQIIDNGFSFNGHTLTVTDNWHTDFMLTSSVIGESNTVKIKTYSADPLKWISLYLGVQRIGDVSDAESEIQLVLSRNYTSSVGYNIDEINHYQAEVLVNVDDTTASLQKVKCQASDNVKNCYEFTINFTVMAPLRHEVMAISAMDETRKQHVTYINEGVEFTGASLLDAHTAQLMLKKTNQGQAEIIELTQQDRRYNVWEDQHGYLWTLNEYGTWTQITAAEFERHQDGTGNVMTRQNSNFASLIEQERQKALLVFDSGDLISELDDYFKYDYSDVDSDMSKLEKYAYKLQLESERAEKYTRQN